MVTKPQTYVESVHQLSQEFFDPKGRVTWKFLTGLKIAHPAMYNDVIEEIRELQKANQCFQTN